MRACEIAQHARFQNLECRTENRLSVCNQIFRIFRLIPSPSICLNLLSLYIRSLKEFDKEKLIRELEQFAEEMRVSPAEAGSASVAADGGSKVSEQSSSASVAADGRSKGPSAGGAVEAADAV